MLGSILSDERRQIARDELHRHVLLVRHASLQHALQQRSSAHHSAREAERESGRSSLHLTDVFRRQLLVRRRIDQHQLLDAVGTVCRQLHRHVASDVDPNDDSSCDAQYRHCGVEILCLRRDAKIGVERPIRLTVSEQIHRIGRMSSRGDRWRDRSPEKIARPESVQENHGGAAVSISLDVYRSRSHWSSQEISLHLDTPLLAFASRISTVNVDAINHERCLPTTTDREMGTYAAAIP